MFHKLFRRIGYVACASSASILSPPAKNKHDNKDFLSKWETLLTNSNYSIPSNPSNDPFNNDINYSDSDYKHPLQFKSNEYEYDLKLLSDISDDFLLFHGTNCFELTEEVGTILQKPVSPLHLGRYADGEVSVQLGVNVRGKSVYIIQSTSSPVHENLMELLLSISAAKRSNCYSVCAIIPYFGYSRQDKKAGSIRGTISASDIAKLFEAVGVDTIITIDLHRRQTQGFFDSTNVICLESLRPVVPVLLGKDLYNPVIVCASDTGVGRAKKLQKLLSCEGILASIAFVTPKTNQGKSIEFKGLSSHHRITETHNSEIIGDVTHRDVIILDDMIDTGSRLINAIKICKSQDAFRIFAYATHGLFSDNAIKKLVNCEELDEIFVSNTVYPPRIDSETLKEIELNQVNCDKLSYVSIGPTIAEAIRRMQIRNSLSSMTHIME